MNNKPFAAKLEPMLAPNKCVVMDESISIVPMPTLMSKKYNGIRAMAMNGDWHSRVGNVHNICKPVRRLFQPLLDYAEKNEVVLDGEFNSDNMNTVGQTRSILAGTIPMPDDFMFKCFYEIPYAVWNTVEKVRMGDLLPLSLPFNRTMIVKQRLVKSRGEAENIIKETSHFGIEGWMFLNPNTFYKHGRTSLLQAKLLKYKYYGDEEDAKIIALEPRRKRYSDVEENRHPTGYAKPSYKKEDYFDTDIAGKMVCALEGDTTQVIYVPFPVGFDLEQRRRAMSHFGSGGLYDLQGEWITFRRLTCEDRDKPVAIKKVQFRDSKG